MKKIIFIAFYFVSVQGFACGGGNYEDGFDFFNLFNQENISNENYYPFLRDDYSTFYGENYYNSEQAFTYHNGNINLWKEILANYSKEEISEIIYKDKQSVWKNSLSPLEKSAKKYLDFAQECSNTFEGRGRFLSWNYDEILKNNSTDNNIIQEASDLSNGEKNIQIKMRYYYQIIRAFHYSKNWRDAVDFYESTIENKLPKNEIYYYIMDQVAGCYYSLENHEKAAYLFTKIISKSADRKKSAFLSFNFCINKGAEGKSYFKGVEDEKELLLIKNLTNFSEDISSLEKFRNLDANDSRIELLFMRHLNLIERQVLPKFIGMRSEEANNSKQKSSINSLLSFSNAQKVDNLVSNTDFWTIANSYLHFLNKDIATASATLQSVNAYKKQKTVLESIYEVSSWETISNENEIAFDKIIIQFENNNEQNDVLHYLKDKIAHTYYKNNKIAQAFLIHNVQENLKNINSIVLINSMIDFKNRDSNNPLETKMNKNVDIDFLLKQKGIFYLLDAKPVLAFEYLQQNKIIPEELISSNIFSNNIKECFDCLESDVMTDKVFQADLFSFIKSEFTRKELANYLIQLENLTKNELQWKVKLANYLLGNYYFNISNTGYFRGILAENSNCCDYDYVDYDSQNNNYAIDVNEQIESQKGYNLFDITYYPSYYFDLSSKAAMYYNNVLENSTDKELNARTLYMVAKCGLNSFYNNNETPEIQISFSKYNTIDLPSYDQSFKVIQEDYSETDFYKMIINDCSYFDAYVNL